MYRFSSVSPGSVCKQVKPLASVGRNATHNPAAGPPASPPPIPVARAIPATPLAPLSPPTRPRAYARTRDRATPTPSRPHPEGAGWQPQPVAELLDVVQRLRPLDVAEQH